MPQEGTPAQREAIDVWLGVFFKDLGEKGFIERYWGDEGVRI